MTIELDESVKRLNRDLVTAAKVLSDQEVRFLVDAYYQMQDDRKRADNQIRALTESQEPHSVLTWLGTQSETLEKQIKRALDYYTDSQPVGLWLRANYGIGPVIAAGLLAHIDIAQAPTSGHIWRYAGLDPTKKWEKGQKRPWNAGLKTLCWKAGQSFMKFSGKEECHYGQVYKARKVYEIERNERGDNAERAKLILETKKFDKSTEAYKAYSVGKLPPGHIDAQARRYAVKLFLSHLHLVWTFIETKALPPTPYAMGQMDHVHFDPPPCIDAVPGLRDALREKGWI